MSVDSPIVMDVDHFTRIKNSSKLILNKFFKNKKYFFGGNIPKNKLFSRDSFEFIVDTDFEMGIKYTYDIIIPQIKNKNKNVIISWDVDKILELIEDMAMHGIPHSAKAGVILLYFKFCYGCKNINREEYLRWAAENPIK